MEKLSELVVMLFVSILSLLNPIHGDMWIMLIVLSANFCIGIFCSVVKNRESFSLSKAFRCVWQGFAFYGLIVMVYLCGHLKGQEDIGLTCVSFITYSVMYFYMMNILKNLKVCSRKDGVFYKCISFCYYILSAKVVEKIPFMKEYLSEIRDN